MPGWIGIQTGSRKLSYLDKDKISLPIAINGKVREVIELDTERVNDKEYLMSAIESSEKLMKWLEGKEIVKEILVPGKMLNLVIKG